jgi:flagellar motility protein MotE (MotC chaperone)
MKIRAILPLALAGVALLAGAAAGPVWFFSKAAPLIAKAAEQRRLHDPKKKQAEQVAQGWDFWTIEIDNLTSELKGEKARLRQESDRLDQRAARIEAEKQELEKLRSEIGAMRQEIDRRVIAINVDEAKNLHSLAQTYSTLTPHAAVAIIKEMDDTTVVKILSLMKPDVVGPIFEEMAGAGGADASLAQHAAVLSDKLRLMKSGTVPNNPVTAN